MGRFHDDFSSSIGKRALKLWTIICTCVRNDLFVDLDIGVQEQNSLINIETLNSELCLLASLRPTVDRTGHRTENGHFLNYARSTSIVSRATDQIIPGLVGNIEI